MNKNQIKTPQDILMFMKEHIKYGWRGCDNRVHLDEMKKFRREYRVQSIDETLKDGFGTCIEQVVLMHELADNINLKNKMFCCRLFEPDHFDRYDEDEHMHCFLLYEWEGKVYHIEHPNRNMAGIYEYPDIFTAIHTIEKYYEEIRGGKKGVTTEFYQAKPGISFEEFNQYINSLDKE